MARAAPGPSVGKRMALVAGPHSGLACSVLTMDLPAGRASVRLELSGAAATVRLSDLGEVKTSPFSALLFNVARGAWRGAALAHS